MSKCTEHALGNMLYEYELGLLDEKEVDRFEAHLLECTFCREQVLEMRQAAELLREDHEVRGVFPKLVQAAEPLASAEEVGERPRPKRKLLIWLRPVAVAAVLAIILVLKPWNIQINPTEEAVATGRVLIIMPFGNIADPADSNKLAAITTNLLATDLSESSHLRVLVGRQGDTKATWVLTGSIVQTEPFLVITTRLALAASDQTVLSGRTGGNRDIDVFGLVDTLGAKIRNELLVPLGFDDQYDPAVASVTTGSAVAYRHYLDGVEYYKRMLLEDARSSWERALEIDSTFAMCYFHLARAFDPPVIGRAVEFSDGASRRERLHILSLEAFYGDDPGRADSILWEIVATHPEDILAWEMLSRVARWQNRPSDAVDYLQKGIDLDPSHKQLYAVLAYLYDELGNVDRAISTADAYVALAPSEPNPYDTRADILAHNGYLDRAIRDYEQVRVIKPNFDDYVTLLELGRLYRYRGDYDRATECALQATSHAGLSVRSTARTDLSLVLVHQGKLAEAWRVLADGMAADRFEQAVPGGHGPGQKNHFVAGLIHLGTGAYDRAAEELALTIQISDAFNPTDSLAYRSLYVLALAEDGQFEEAEEVVKYVEECGLHDSIAEDIHRIARGFLDFASGDFRSAQTSLEQVSTKTVRESLSIQFWLARSYLESGKYEQAVDVFSDLLLDYSDQYRNLMPLWAVQAHYFAARAYEAAERHDEATAQYRTFLEIWKDADPELHPLISDATLRLERLENRP